LSVAIQFMSVIPVETGIHMSGVQRLHQWIPIFVGMTIVFQG